MFEAVFYLLGGIALLGFGSSLCVSFSATVASERSMVMESF